jgi:hypothetical protein
MVEPTAIPKPTPEDAVLDSGNLMLMEARFLQLVSSIRALVRSNEDLEEALKDSPEDGDFLAAISENKLVIGKNRKYLLDLVMSMKRLGGNIDLPDDIRDLNIEAWPSSSVSNHGTVEGSGGDSEGLFL